MDYNTLLLTLAKNPSQFYHILIANTGTLLREIEATNQGKVASDLKLSSTQFSHILKLLKELYYAK